MAPKNVSLAALLALATSSLLALVAGLPFRIKVLHGVSLSRDGPETVGQRVAQLKVVVENWKIKKDFRFF
jgi:hypothetical protein